MFDWITDLVSGNEWTYLIVFAVTALDVVFPLLPAETVVLTAAIVAANGGLAIWLIIPVTALGALLGDHVAFALGRSVGEPVTRRMFRSQKSMERLCSAQATVRRSGPSLILAGRFIPGGRTATTFAAGSVSLEYRRFATIDVIAAVSWAIYICTLGYVGGASFEDSLWKPLLLAAGVAAVVSLGVEALRRRTRGRRRDDEVAPGPPPAESEPAPAVEPAQGATR